METYTQYDHYSVTLTVTLQKTDTLRTTDGVNSFLFNA